MMRRHSTLLLGIAAGMLAAGGGNGRPAQREIIRQWPPPCPADRDNYREWQPSRQWRTGETQLVPASAIREVAADGHDLAVRMLSEAEAVPLNDVELSQLTNRAAKPNELEGLTPYLIRNVVPSVLSGGYGGAIRVERVQNTIQIRAGLFGCGDFFKNPLIVFLDTRPDRVDIEALAIW